MAQRNVLAQYRLRRLAIQLREFTVSELETAAGITSEMVHNFLYELKKVNSKFFDKEPAKAEGPGRPPMQYKLTPEAMEFLANQNLELARELRQSETLTRPATVTVVSRPAVAAAGHVQEDLRAPLQCIPEPAVVFGELEPEWTALNKLGGSVMWVKPGQASSVRTGTEVQPVSRLVRTIDELVEIARKILTPWQRDILKSKGSVKCAYELPDLGRCGLNFHSVSGALQIELRRLPHSIPTFEDLYLPHAVSEFSKTQSGLIVVAGIGGSGRSRTLAALLERINETRKGFIATIEEPALYQFQQKQCVFEQRQVGIDTPDFWTALTDSLEERVDVLSMSDVDDPKTFATALAAADRSLILCRVTAPSSVEALEKLIEMAPSAERATIRSRMANNLVGIIGLTAVPRDNEPGFVCAAEVFRFDNAARDLVREGTNLRSLPDYLRRHDPDSQTFDMAIEKLHRKHLVSEQWFAQRCATASER